MQQTWTVLHHDGPNHLGHCGRMQFGPSYEPMSFSGMAHGSADNASNIDAIKLVLPARYW